MKNSHIEIAGQSPFELMPLGAIPYAMWAEKSLTVANDSIGTEQIKNGSIQAEDIDPLAFSDIQGQVADGQVPSSVATDAELGAHSNSATAHPASAIVVSGSFVTFVADDVQEALFKLDAKLVDEIVNRQNGQKKLTDDVTALQTVTSNINNIPGTLGESKIDGAIARDSEYQAGDAALQTQINTANTNITNLQTATSDINNIPGILGEAKIDGAIARDSEVTAAVGAEAIARATADTAEATARSGADTALQGNIDSEAGTRASADTTLQTNITNEASTRSSTDTTLQGNIDSEATTRASADTGLQGQIDGHETRIGVLEGATVPFTDVTGQIAESQVPQYMRPFAFGSASPLLQSGSYNVAGVLGGLRYFSVTFQNAATNSNYVVMAVRKGPPLGGNSALTVENKTTGGFGISANTDILYGVEFVVFGNF